MDSVGYGIGAFFVVLVVLFALYFPLGLLTGIFGICAFASAEWEIIYWKLGYFFPVIAIISAVAAYKYADRNSLK
jgi:hypothetical protein